MLHGAIGTGNRRRALRVVYPALANGEHGPRLTLEVLDLQTGVRRGSIPRLVRSDLGTFIDSMAVSATVRHPGIARVSVRAILYD